MGAVLFAIVAALALAGGVGVIAARRPVHSALALLLVLGCLAVDYLLLDAPFIAALQIIIYAGAIVVLFLFIVMLLAVRSGEDPRLGRLLPPAAAAVLCAVFLAGVLSAVLRPAPSPAAPGTDFGTVQAVGRLVFGRYLLPFEAASVVLLVGMIGAVALGRRLAASPPASGSALDGTVRSAEREPVSPERTPLPAEGKPVPAAGERA
jgi:NADH-quinone oxidoreductase subunit J